MDHRSHSVSSRRRMCGAGESGDGSRDQAGQGGDRGPASGRWAQPERGAPGEHGSDGRIECRPNRDRQVTDRGGRRKDLHAAPFAAVSVAWEPPNGRSSRNHKRAGKGTPKRKETNAKIPDPCKFPHFKSAKTRGTSMAPEFFTGDEGRYRHCTQAFPVSPRRQSQPSKSLLQFGPSAKKQGNTSGDGPVMQKGHGGGGGWHRPSFCFKKTRQSRNAFRRPAFGGSNAERCVIEAGRTRVAG